jgi:hypothetical protein
MTFAPLVAVILLAASPSVAADAWSEWGRLSHLECPTHHVELICGDCYLNLIEGFDATLTRSQQRRVAQVAAIRRDCADEVMGFNCEATRTFTAYRRLGLMRRFVRYGCETIKCEEAAICSRLPHPR